MSKVHSLIGGWVGYGDGGAVLVEVGQEFDENDPLVLERPELFTEPEKPAPVPAPRPAARQKSSNG